MGDTIKMSPTYFLDGDDKNIKEKMDNFFKKYEKLINEKEAPNK